MYQCSNPADVRKLLHEDHENISLLKESCEPTITLIKDIFGHLKLKENYIRPCDVIEDEKDEFFSDLNLYENISPNETAKELSEHPLLERYLQHTCRERKHFFSVKKCAKNDCTSCFAPRLPSDVFDTLHHLPDPEPDIANKGHYKLFHESFGTETGEKYLLSPCTENRSHKIPFNPLKQHANNTRIVLKCKYCNKPRLDYSRNKVTSNITTKVIKETSDLYYICGTGIDELSNKEQYKVLHVRQNLRCQDLVEVIYFSMNYEKVCVQCGTTRKLRTQPNEQPMCNTSRRSKKKPVMRRKAFQKK